MKNGQSAVSPFRLFLPLRCTNSGFRIPRHSLTARLFHWIMAAAMLVLLFTAFLPKVGIQFNWVTYHWIAGSVLTVSIIFHIIHATFYLDFWSIWPDRRDIEDARKRFQRFIGTSTSLPRKFPWIRSAGV